MLLWRANFKKRCRACAGPKTLMHRLKNKPSVEPILGRSQKVREAREKKDQMMDDGVNEAIQSLGETDFHWPSPRPRLVRSRRLCFTLGDLTLVTHPRESARPGRLLPCSHQGQPTHGHAGPPKRAFDHPARDFFNARSFQYWSATAVTSSRTTIRRNRLLIPALQTRDSQKAAPS